MAMTRAELDSAWRNAVRCELLAIAREFGYDEMMRRARIASASDIGDEVREIADDVYTLHLESEME